MQIHAALAELVFKFKNLNLPIKSTPFNKALILICAEAN
jgi:hypothetical protein